ncbi:hypothetical protein PsorP6_000745 [Peronosclerospora sorghi]|uniref:Uncharacterized protein n=1 Tax=Peronosclerospora sorghi TaxID=230839 RepID=A0ACC0WSN2_9STRA|nr:hypothetical protein PsorP6_000745 [Peronosclerospora sorghi]
MVTPFIASRSVMFLLFTRIGSQRLVVTDVLMSQEWLDSCDSSVIQWISGGAVLHGCVDDGCAQRFAFTCGCRLSRPYQMIVVLSGHGNSVNQLKFHLVSPSLLFSAGKHESIRFWNWVSCFVSSGIYTPSRFGTSGMTSLKQRSKSHTDPRPKTRPLDSKLIHFTAFRRKTYMLITWMACEWW